MMISVIQLYTIHCYHGDGEEEMVMEEQWRGVIVCVCVCVCVCVYIVTLFILQLTHQVIPIMVQPMHAAVYLPQTQYIMH